MSLTTKLTLAFALVITLFGGVTVFSVSLLSEMAGITSRLYDEPLVGVNYTRSAQSKFAQVRAEVERALLAPESILEGNLSALESRIADIDADLEVVRERIRDVQVRQVVENAEVRLKDWFGAVREVLSPPGGARQIPIQHVIVGKGDAALAALDAAVEFSAAHGFDFRQRADAELQEGKIKLLASALGVTALAILLALAFSRSILGPVRAATDIAERVSQGVFSDQIVTRRRDELGRLLAALAHMQMALRHAAETDRVAAQAKDRALLRTRQFLDGVIESVPAMVLIKETQHDRLVMINRAGEDLLGLPRDEVIGRTYRDIFSPGQSAALEAADREVLRSGELLVLEEDEFTSRTGSSRFVRTKKLPILDERGEPEYLLSMCEDITDRKHAELQLSHMAYHDALTELPNRVLFRELADEALGRVRRGESLAVLYADLDHFKSVNDTLGHPLGDALLRAVTKRLRSCVRDADTVARLGGDEFAIMQVGSEQPVAATALATRMIEALSAPYEIDGHQVVIGVSVGIAMAPQDGADPDRLLKNADLALYKAKGDGRGTYRFFEPDLDGRMQARRALELDLRKALDSGEFEVFYQPLVDLRANKIAGFEALLRWNHPQRGHVSAAEFVPLAEDIGLIVPIGGWVLEQACREAATWPDGISVAVNISPIQFRSGTLALSVVGALAASGLPASRLEVEITERVLLQDTQATVAVLHQLRSLGVRISMDDFGTGYSSLSYLRSFPFDKIKIDRSFIQELGEKADCTAIVRAIAGLAANLGMATTAEGIETPEQLAAVRGEGCSEGQGYFYGRPMPASAIPGMLAAFPSVRRGAA